MSKEKNLNSLNENELNQVSGGAIGPDPLMYAIKARGMKYGSEEFKNYCKEIGENPDISMDEIIRRQESRNATNRMLSENYRRGLFG